MFNNNFITTFMTSLFIPAFGYSASTPTFSKINKEKIDIGIQCDNLVANPTNQDNPNEILPVEFLAIKPSLAIASCQQAVTKYPNVIRYQYNLARAYDAQGEYNKAFKIYSRLANQGYAAAQVGLGLFYNSGIGVRQSYSQALYWFQQSVKKGSAVGMNNIGVMYFYGNGVTQSDTVAFAYFLNAAEQGYGEAQYYVGELYQLGRGTVQSLEKAIYWYNKSAEQGNQSAKKRLAALQP